MLVKEWNQAEDMLSLTKQLMMQSHIDYLCNLHDLDVIYITSPEAAEGWMDDRLIWIPRPKSLVPYFVALHEVGHFCIDRRIAMLPNEAAAWNWALETSKFKPTKKVWEQIYSSLTNYINKAKRDKRVSIPNNSSEFWKLYEEAKNKVNA